MKKAIPVIIVIFAALVFLVSFSSEKADLPVQAKIENTLKSVSLFKDTVGVDSKQLLADFEKVNKAIAEIGYPDAGYSIWEVKSEDAGFRYMIEGFWPDMETYREIHNHELYKKATSVESASFNVLKQTWYYRFEMVR